MTTSRSARRPTMIDVARDAGVSLKTVSRVVNRVETVDPDLTERVLSSIRKLGYRRNDVAATLRSGTETRTLALLTADLQNAFYTPIALGLASVAREHGYQLITASSEEDPERERRAALDLCQRRVDALVVVPTTDDHSYLRPDVASGVPVVFVDRPGSGIEADEVLLDNRGGADAAITALLEQGHRRIALLLDHAGIRTMQERFAGATDALRRAGLPSPEALTSWRVHTPEDAGPVLAALLALDDPPTAVFCGNNRGVVGTVESLWRSGRQLAVAGFDDFETSHLMPFPLTLVAYDAAALGRTAGELVFDRLAGEDGPPRRVLLPTRLLTRGGRPAAPAAP